MTIWNAILRQCLTASSMHRLRHSVNRLGGMMRSFCECRTVVRNRR
ncbi:unnamed protein product [Chondrus crispus]|uniref:Uncharacterized protein n=1 Tax=Chondrus crispus TaxID=2769 RepID=R7QU87_CHOCR|nr:unnamed protein product [Chondrus crispus]CDF41031.1 unnamed protein product [Chondrus crispus]|eukprot:XP_005711325.1 unnamed protein product [Chondrus crispus]